jgi:hypothetical protein
MDKVFEKFKLLPGKNRRIGLKKRGKGRMNGVKGEEDEISL